MAYELHGKQVKVIWTVRNHDDHEMIYSIGAHGAYRCPIVHGEEFSDCYLEFNHEEDAPNMPLNKEGQYLRTHGTKPLKGTKLPLYYEEFKDDVLAYHNLKSDKVTLRSTKSSKSLSVIAKDFPYWGFWTPGQGGAPFICLEPWHGHADYEDFDGDFADREGSERLAAGEEAMFTYTIEIG